MYHIIFAATIYYYYAYCVHRDIYDCHMIDILYGFKSSNYKHIAHNNLILNTA